MTAMHVGSVLVFDTPDEGFDLGTLLDLVANRVAYVHRYRQKVRHVPAGLGGPVWVDDENFDLAHHVRGATLPRPGNAEQLEEFVARIQARLLDRDRPLWEVYLLDGLVDGRFALVTKIHQAMVDGINRIDIGQVILDDAPSDVVPIPQTWTPTPEPSGLELLTRSALQTAGSPRRIIDTVRGGLEDLRHTGGRVVGVAQQATTTLLRTAASPAPSTPLNAPVGSARRIELLDLELADVRAVRSKRFGSGDHGSVSVNDVVLATIAGALREWLMMRGEPVTASTTLRAMVPLSVSEGEDSTHVGGQVVACFVDLPLGEPSPGMRLQQVSFRMASQRHGQAIAASGLAGLAGFAPPTLHLMAARLASAVSRRVFNLVVSNVPGPQQPRYAGRTRMVASYPVIPLARGQALAIGLTSYDGRVHLGLNGDRDAMHDLDVLAECLHTALDELVADAT